MEGHPEESDEDIQGESKTVVLWQKHIQQRIFIDLSDDDSLHLSDLDHSIDLRVSQSESEPSVNLNMSAELSDLEDSSSDSSVEGSQSEMVEQSQKNSSVLPVSVQRPDTLHEDTPVHKHCEDPGQNTSDEEQEDLPYDGHLSGLYFQQTSSPEGNSSSDGTIHPSPDLTLEDKDGEVKSQESLILSPKDEGGVDDQLPNISQVLLRHLSKEQLLLPGRLLELETLPDVSLLDSWTPTLHSAIQSHLSERSGLDLNQHTDVTDDNPSEEDPQITSLHEGTLDDDKQDVCDEGTCIPRVPLVRTRSFSDFKYGQGQVHYPLPDFSKIAPKVKIPKVPSGPVKPCPQVVGSMHRAQSSPGMLNLISRVLEDSVQPTERSLIFRDLERKTVPALAHQLQADYDDLLSTYAEAEQVLHELNIQSNATRIVDLIVDNDEAEGQSSGRNPLGTFAPHISGVLNDHFKLMQDTQDLNITAENQPSVGEEMTAELRLIINQFMLTVEEFKHSVSIKSLSLEEQQMMLRNVREAQDQLERKYMSKKEEHRALEMQNYMGLDGNTGTFDLERLLEGDIFRAGMLLDDIKGMIDAHLCEQNSEPQSSHKDPDPCLQNNVLLPPASTIHLLHEVHTDAETTQSTMERRESCGDGGTERTVRPFEPDNMDNLHSTRRSRSRVSAFGVQSSSGEDDEERSSTYSDGIISSNVVTDLSGLQTQAESKQEGDLSDDEERNPGGFPNPSPKFSSSDSNPASTHKHLSPPLTSSTFQVVVSSETDSGFGSSYLHQSGNFHSSLTSESRDQTENLSSSDSDSNPQTTIHPADQWTITPPSLQPPRAASVELWVQSTENGALVRDQGDSAGSHIHRPAHLHQHMPETILDTSMEAAQRDRLCTCNSEAIVALQFEVSRLKQELKEGLVQLPQLAQKMDYLTSKYRQERRSRTRSHQRPSSFGKQRSKLSVRIDDWISTDLDHSRSKDVDNDDDTGGSETELRFDTSPIGGSRGSVVSEFQHVLQETLQNSKENALATTRLRLKGERSNRVRQRMQSSNFKDFSPDDRWPLISSPSLQKPLLQVNYGSSSSLPASYKYREAPVQSLRHHIKRPTQSDSALLPSDVYFLRTPSPAPKTGRRRDDKEEAMNRSLDQAIEVARSMRRTTDRMARTLSADLARAEHRGKLRNNQPPGGGRHQAS